MAKKKEENIEEVEKTENIETAPINNEELVYLEIKIGFTDKYTDERYVEGKSYPFTKERANELLADPRKLVSKA